MYYTRAVNWVRYFFERMIWNGHGGPLGVLLISVHHDNGLVWIHFSEEPSGRCNRGNVLLQAKVSIPAFVNCGIASLCSLQHRTAPVKLDGRETGSQQEGCG